jgi:hypothetical protein
VLGLWRRIELRNRPHWDFWVATQTREYEWNFIYEASFLVGAAVDGTHHGNHGTQIAPAAAPHCFIPVIGFLKELSQTWLQEISCKRKHPAFVYAFNFDSLKEFILMAGA